VLALLLGEQTKPEQLVRNALSQVMASPLEDAAWSQLLHDGFVEGSIAVAASPSLVEGFDVAPVIPDNTLEIVFTSSSSTYDGRFANNGWLQETPDFITKVVWDNVAVVSPMTARELKLSQNEIVALKLNNKKIELPVYILPGQANNSIGVALGYGRRAAGKVGGSVAEHAKIAGRSRDTAEVIGANAYQLRSSATPLLATGVAATGTDALTTWLPRRITL
jgi:anaerobic selenocysteine-containing dehydrogenase